MTDSRPIGVFDSGVGGLTVVHALRKRLPSESIVYLGDTARLPYGTKSHGTIERYTLQAGALLQRFDPKLLVIACNTASAHGLEALKRESPAPVIGVIEPGAALAALVPGPVGVLCTNATLQSGAYEKAIRQRNPGAEVHTLACPLLVPLAEEGWFDDPITVETIRRYVADLPPAVKTLVLGCTHYPVLKASLEKAHPGMAWIDSGEAAALAVEKLLTERNAKREGSRGEMKVLLTDPSSRLQEVGSRFLGEELGVVEVVDI
ncbi:MAG: glutamate racemase [Acidobacteria bacterium]|nr:glutamate racemase [Acidobacteriota bacterium]